MYDITPQINERGGNAMRGLQLHTIHFLGYLRKLAGSHHDFHGPQVLLIFFVPLPPYKCIKNYPF